jgi:DNA-binding response OmpR family regulator
MPETTIASSARSRILVVEDEAKTRASLAEGLGLQGWDVATAASGDEGMSYIERQTFDLVVLDWMLPGLSGLEVLTRLRQRGGHLPVLMLTARDAVDERVAGLDKGADDYLTKPFALAELVARCHALLRRATAYPGTVLSCEDLQLDVRARVALRGGREMALSPREVDVLEYLLRHQGQVVTREMLERDVWKQSGRFTSLDNVIDVQMARLRRKVDEAATDKLIHTLRGLGYRLGKQMA